jgi:acyl-CoA reductase-like NAD-dependent aldehyde dehydrogenase
MQSYRDRFQQLALLTGHDAGASGTRAVRSPFDGELLGVLPMSGSEEMDRYVHRARAAQAEWSRVSTRKRVAIVLRFQKLLLARCESLLDVLQLETGKARRHGFEEVADVAFVIGYYAGAAPRLLRARKRKGAVPGLTRTSVLRHPRGVVGVIAPWNYPLVLAVSDSLPAVLAGNAVIVKPDFQTTHTALAALELLLEAGLPPGVFQVAPGDGPVAGSALVDRADYISFTGSTETGRLVARRAGERLVDCSLELGGKNAMIVRRGADLDRAVAGAIRGCFANAGQLCISTERVIVHESLYEPFLAALASRARELRLGAGLDYEADMGSLTYEYQLRKVEEHVADALERGASIHSGGRTRPDVGPWFYEPTLLTGVSPDMRLYGEETFGPVVAVAPYGADEEAVARVNETAYGLNASIWSQDIDAALRMASQIHAGTVNVNESYSAAWGSVDAPMGGRGWSGTGRRHGPEGLLKFTESQTVAVQRGAALDLSAAWLASPRRRRAVLSVLRRFRPGASRG